VFYIRKNKTSKSASPDSFYRRCFSAENYDLFRNIIQDNNFETFYANNDAQKSMTYFHSLLCKAYNTAFPLRRCNSRYYIRKPWLTEALKNSIKRKNDLYINLKKRFTEEKHNYYKMYKSELNKVLRKAEREYYLEKFDKEQNNIKKTWSILKDVINTKKKQQCSKSFTHNGIEYTNPKQIADKFNNYFANIGSDLASKINNNHVQPLSFLKGNYPNSMFLTPTNAIEISNVIKSLKISSPGYDDITSKVLKESVGIIAPLLEHVINNSLLTGVFPKELKISNIIPLYKSGNMSKFTNYRPISLLSSVSKVFEKIFYKRLLSFLKMYDILYKLQFGFREGHSTNMAMFVLLDKIVDAIENDEYAVGIFLDFSKAFDTVDHKILLDKLYFYGIRGTPHLWLESYLSERVQFTTFDGKQSEYKPIKCGVPQGSILGPLLFLIYINDLAFISETIYSIMFADDTSIFLTGKNLDEIISSLNDELQIIVQWLDSNKLSLNIDKTHYMIFKPRNKDIIHNTQLTIRSQNISKVDNCKFLGVMLDDQLNWQTHINYIKNKVAKATGVLYNVRRNLLRKHMITLYNSLIYPYLSYCNTIWASATKNALNPLILIQKQVIRCICFLKKNQRTSSYFKPLNIMKLNELRTFSEAAFMYKLHNNLLPSMFQNYFVYNRTVNPYVTRQRDLIRVPRYTSMLSKNFIKYKGAKTWNYVMTNININVKFSTFKKLLKTHLMKDY
jgi:hypothetical protein